MRVREFQALLPLAFKDIRECFYSASLSSLYFSTDDGVHRLKEADLEPELIVRTEGCWFNLLVDSTETMLFAATFELLQVFDFRRDVRVHTTNILGEEANGKLIKGLSFAKQEEYLVVNVENRSLIIFNARTRIPLFETHLGEQSAFFVVE